MVSRGKKVLFLGFLVGCFVIGVFFCFVGGCFVVLIFCLFGFLLVPVCPPVPPHQ